MVGENRIALEHLSFDGRFYNAEIQLNLDGAYIVNAVEEVVIAPTATYKLTFDSTWSAATHPYEYPTGNSHYSGLIGGTHKANVRFWERSQVASPGMERMAELGSKSPLREEFEAAITNGEAEQVLSGGGIGSWTPFRRLRDPRAQRGVASGLARMFHQHPGCWRRAGAAGRRAGAKPIAVAMG